MTNDLLIDLGYMLRASKRPAYKKSVRASVGAFVNVLVRENLFSNKLSFDAAQLQDDLQIFEEDLTETGVLYYDRVFLKWIGKIDKGTDPSDTIYLEREYARLSQNKT